MSMQHKGQRLPNLCHALPPPMAEESVDVLVSAAAVRIERIVSYGHRTPVGAWYDQQEYEWVAVLRGAARIRCEGPAGVVWLSEGDQLLIPPHCRHRVEWTLPGRATVWLAVFYAEDAAPPECSSLTDA